MKKVLLACALIGWAVASHAAPLSTNWWEGEHANGDWGGHRSELAARGYTFFADYNAIVAGNTSGGSIAAGPTRRTSTSGPGSTWSACSAGKGPPSI
jgi:carbohydrate-selective porin OprB